MIERAASDPSVDIDKLDRLLAMRERENARIAEQAFSAALAARRRCSPSSWTSAIRKRALASRPGSGCAADLRAPASASPSTPRTLRGPSKPA
jgi:hypothetical protein